MARPSDLLSRGLRLEYVTLGWNVIGVILLALAAVVARSVALAAFAFDSLVEIGASTVVVWELTSTNTDRERRALDLLGWAFVLLVPYVLVVAAAALLTGTHASSSSTGIVWTAATFVVMAALAVAKRRTGDALDNDVLRTEGRVTMIDAYLAAAVLTGLTLNATIGWWWADPLASLVVVFYAVREANEIFTTPH